MPATEEVESYQELPVTADGDPNPAGEADSVAPLPSEVVETASEQYGEIQSFSGASTSQRLVQPPAFCGQTLLTLYLPFAWQCASPTLMLIEVAAGFPCLAFNTKIPACAI